jgi:ribonuclease HII
MQILGIDEAGRGPVIGPMVIAGAMSKLDLSDWNLKDSKLLSPQQRELMYDRIVACKDIAIKARVLQPKEIDDALNSPNLNLNGLEAVHSAIIINELKPDKTILDLPSNNAEAYNAFVKKNMVCECEIISEHKADANYPIVSAASIIAKVTRDTAIQAIKEKYKIEFGRLDFRKPPL